MSSMKELVAAAGGLCVLIAIGSVLTFATEFGNILFTCTIDVQQQKADREVYEQSPQFIEGKEQDIGSFYAQYKAEKDPAIKEALRQRILDTVQVVHDEKQLNARTRQILAEVGHVVPYAH